MRFIAISQATASWILSHKTIFDALIRTLENLADQPSLKYSVLVAGPIRIASTANGRSITIWNVDYLSSSGNENWGFLRLDGRHGALDAHRFGEMFSSALPIFDARLQNLLLPDRMRVRTHGDSMSTAVMGVGRQRQSASVGYLEVQTPTYRSIFVVGPADEEGNLDRSLSSLLESLREIRPHAESIISTVNELPLEARRRPATEHKFAQELRRELGQDEETAPIIHTPTLRETYDEKLLHLTYEQWVQSGSQLGSEKRRILESNLIEAQPLRLVGPAGSGKSLLMQLMAVRAAKKALETGRESRILYLVHNVSLMTATRARIETLWPLEQRPPHVCLEVMTLQTYCREKLNIDVESLIDADAGETKSYQHALVGEILRTYISNVDKRECPLFFQSKEKTELLEAIVWLVVHEIGIVIKAYNMSEERRRYVESERPLSRFHSLLSPKEREIVFDSFREYQRQVFETAGLLDSDDLALSMLNQLRTPVWSLKRKSQGYDYLFIDETQLYNENERRLFPLLTRMASGNLPIAIAIDEAQSIEAVASAGFAALGFSNLRNETLQSVYRSTVAILKLAFHVIQRTTDLFGPDFPDYTVLSQSIIPDDHAKAYPPRISRAASNERSAVTAAKLAHKIRQQNLRHVCIVTLSDRFLVDAADAVKKEMGNEAILLQHRGQTLDLRRPFVAISPVRFVGGQEFDAVILLGAEMGSYPPKVPNEALTATLEQQCLRELYLSLTRARYQVHVVLSESATLSPLLQGAVAMRLLVEN